MKSLTRIFVAWLPLGIAITGMCLLIYAAVQHNYRSSLNDPQIQLAEDGARALAGGAVPADIVPRGQTVDIGKSLAPFVAVYDEQGTPLESTGVLDGAPPKPPKGVFDYARAHGNNLPHNTWQPDPDVRIALVVEYVPQAKQFVASGRNMREVENRESDLSWMVFLVWIFTLVVTFVAKFFSRYFGK